MRAVAVGIRDLARDVRNGLRLKTSFLAAKRRGDIRMRIAGLESLLQAAKDATVLDLGCFDGLIAYDFARSGARLIHGLDNDALHLDTAGRIFSQVDMPSVFVHADLRKPNAIGHALGDLACSKYDIVLFLGVFQHIYRSMSMRQRQDLVDSILDRAGSFLAIRTPQDVWPELERLLPPGRVELVGSLAQVGNVGELRIFDCR
jgi:SAM-dependent methyltransferase